MRFHPTIAPIKVGVFPLVKNKPELYGKAREIFAKLQRRWNCFWDESGAIGRRYRRMDEAGTRWCVTVDFQTLEDGTVTLRDRDSMKQERIAIPALIEKMDIEIGYDPRTPGASAMFVQSQVFLLPTSPSISTAPAAASWPIAPTAASRIPVAAGSGAAKDLTDPA
jgi:hypothetical protein